MRRNSSEHMKRLLNDLALAGVRATAQTLEAHNPAEAIVGHSEQLKVDLIVAGTHSRHGLARQSWVHVWKALSDMPDVQS
jgi:nucleotide-binding universal stress UspA family protein